MPIRLTGIHLLITYRCTRACDHCFVWGSPNRTGAMTTGMIATILEQARAMKTVTSIFFEGGEPFLEYGVLHAGVRAAHDAGFSTGIVTNGFWAVNARDARWKLEPFAGILGVLQVSRDDLHGSTAARARSDAALAAALSLGIPASAIEVAGPAAMHEAVKTGTPPAVGPLMYRGRAAAKLGAGAVKRPTESFTRCPYERLADPRRVHVDLHGEVHLCQGLSLGNLTRTPLAKLCAGFDPAADPIAGPLIAGGPAELARRHGVPVAASFADACHLCDTVRRTLRPQFPDVLRPDEMYGAEAPGRHVR